MTRLNFKIEEILTKHTNAHPPRREFVVELFRPPLDVTADEIFDLPDIPAHGEQHGKCNPPCQVSSRSAQKVGPARWTVYVVYRESDDRKPKEDPFFKPTFGTPGEQDENR